MPYCRNVLVLVIQMRRVVAGIHFDFVRAKEKLTVPQMNALLTIRDQNILTGMKEESIRNKIWKRSSSAELEG